MKISEPITIIFYLDITGFTTWSRRVQRDQVRDLLENTYEMYDRWSEKTGMWIKKMSDGFIGVRELEDFKKRTPIVLALRDAYNITVEVNKYLGDLPFPRPRLCRLRGVLGDSWKLVEESGRVDYGGYQMNFGKRMLDIQKQETMIMVSEGVYDALGRKSCAHLEIEKAVVEPVSLIGVEEIDQKNFYTYRFNDKRCKGVKNELCDICPVRPLNKGR